MPTFKGSECVFGPIDFGRKKTLRFLHILNTDSAALNMERTSSSHSPSENENFQLKIHNQCNR